MATDRGEPPDRAVYTVGVMDQLRIALRRRDIFVTPRHRWADPYARLLQGAAWESLRPQICRSLQCSPDAEHELQRLMTVLAETYQRVAANIPTNTDVRIEQNDGRTPPIITPLERRDEPSSLKALRHQVSTLLPHAHLPDVLLEVHALTRFLNEFTHVSESDARVQDIDISLCAVLVAEACTIGIAAVADPTIPALTPARLLWVQQQYIRSETITRANARFVEYQHQIPLAQFWGGGDVASADGLRFVVPVRTVHAAPNTKYFRPTAQGVTFYNWMSDQYTGFYGLVIPGTLRDSFYVLEGLLEHQTSLRLTEIMTDTHGYSDRVFGLFWLLGYQFSPRHADISETRFWRIDRQADYGSLNTLARSTINTRLIFNQWDNLLRVAGSRILGTVSATEMMYAFQRGNRATTVARALSEVGKIAKTVFLLKYLDDSEYRRRILTQLNRGESRHTLARHIFYGQRGEVRQKYRQGQEDQVGVLGLVVNSVVLWNTRSMDAAMTHLRTHDEPPQADDKEMCSMGSKSVDRMAYSLAQGLWCIGIERCQMREEPFLSLLSSGINVFSSGDSFAIFSPRTKV